MVAEGNTNDPKEGNAEEDEQPANTYIIRPNYQNKFRSAIVKELIHHVLQEKLTGITYNQEESTELSKQLSDEIKTKLKEAGYDRYKFVVQVVLGEQKGEGVKMAARCFWDSDTDNYAQEMFMSLSSLYYELCEQLKAYSPSQPSGEGYVLLCGHCFCYILLLVRSAKKIPELLCLC